MFKNQPSRLTAILLALLVVVLWSSSWVLIKLGLPGVPPVTFAGLRYGLGFLILTPFMFTKSQRAQIKNLSKKDWSSIIILGILNIAITQGAQYLGLSLLPAVTVSLILQLTSLLVAMGGLAILKEIPTWLQWTGVALNLIGILIYFAPFGIRGNQALGIGVVTVALIANSATMLISRKMNKSRRVSPLLITGLSMGVGALVMLLVGWIAEPQVTLSVTNLLITLWLAVLNTAFAFTLWNYTLQTLTAMESSIITGTMIIFIVISAAIFLGEQVDVKGAIGLLLTGVGAILVQLRRNNRANRQTGT